MLLGWIAGRRSQDPLAHFLAASVLTTVLAATNAAEPWSALIVVVTMLALLTASASLALGISTAALATTTTTAATTAAA